MTESEAKPMKCVILSAKEKEWLYNRSEEPEYYPRYCVEFDCGDGVQEYFKPNEPKKVIEYIENLDMDKIKDNGWSGRVAVYWEVDNTDGYFLIFENTSMGGEEQGY